MFRTFGAHVASLLVLVTAAGCGATSWQAGLPSDGAYSPAAPPAIPVPVTTALDAEPPLPGEATEGWPGLARAPRTRATTGASARVSSVGPAGRPATLDADASVRRALEGHRELQARLAELGVARGRALQAGRPPNPELEVEVLPERESRLELALAYDLTSLVLAPLRAKAARSAVDAERLDVAALTVRVGYAARSAFYALQAAEARLALAQRALDALAAERDAIAALYEAGNVPAVELEARTAAYETERVEVSRLALEVSDARESLARVLGVHGPEAGFVVTPALPAVAETTELPGDVETRAVEASLELASMRAALDAVARDARVARVEGRLPDIAIDLHVLYGNPERSETDPSPDPVGFGGGVSIGVPLFDRQQGRRAALDAALEAGRFRYEGLAIEIRSVARASANRLASVEARARHFEGVVRPLRRRVLEETRRQYNAMQVDVFRLLAAHRELLDAELAYVDTLRELGTARAALEALLAGVRVEDTYRAAAPRLGTGGDAEGGH